jgi:hypothetical protein
MAAAAVLLGRPDQTSAQKGVGFAGNRRCPGSMACSGELDVVSESGAEVVWGGEVGGVSSTEGSAVPFIGGRRGSRRCLVVARSQLGPARE